MTGVAEPLPLTSQTCVACRRDALRVTDEEMAELLPEIPNWELQDHDGVPRLVQTFRVRTFRDAMALTNAIADLAEAEGHHPALLTEWGKVTVSWWTHKIRGLHRNDFIMAAKTDALVAEYYPSGNDATTS